MRTPLSLSFDSKAVFSRQKEWREKKGRRESEGGTMVGKGDPATSWLG